MSVGKQQHTHFWSDVVVRCFPLWQTQTDLQGDEGAHRHVEEDLPEVAQLVQVHVTQADEAKSQEGLDVSPQGEVDKQVTLIQTGCRSQEEGNHVIKVLILVLYYALDGVDPSKQIETGTEDAEYTGHHPRQRHRLQHLVRSYSLVLGRGVLRETIDQAHVLPGELVGRPQLDLSLHVGQVDLGGQGARTVVALLCLLDKRIKLDEGVGPHSVVDALGIVGDDELPLELVQETESQDVGVGVCAHHQVAHAQRTGEIDIKLTGFEGAAVRELAEFFGQALEVLLGLLKPLILLIVRGGREWQPIPYPHHGRK